MELVHFRQYGTEGPPLYILHGVFGMLDNWHYAAGILGRHHRVITFDARNHGRSFHHPDCSYEAMAADLCRLMEHLGDNEATILGHSMGGKTAMIFADLYPQRIQRLICVDIAPKRYPPGHADYFKAFETLPFHSMKSRREAEDAFLPFAPDMGVRQFLLKNLEPLPEGGYKPKLNLQALKTYYDEIIGELHFSSVLEKPSLWITGDKSAYVKEEDKPGIRNHFPLTQFIVIPQAGHWVHADNPPAFIAAVESFLLQYPV
ncbi:MAG: alpha/beta fold hydrolase [Bacteroidetes bacterium]|nr:alpha/beta fold hydrolase [Bacteroidota bacterium]